jgi:hypothetical protein
MGASEEVTQDVVHVYWSTYCLHGYHEDCRLTCKICDAPCVCVCHERKDVTIEAPTASARAAVKIPNGT